MGPPGDVSAPCSPKGSAIERQFQHLGWCSHQFRRLQQERSSGTLHYLSTLDRRNCRPNNHITCIDQPCCVANNVHAATYVTKHTQTCSGTCSFVGVDYNHVVDIIDAGGVPIVGIHLDPTPTTGDPVLHLTVTPRAISTRYTVISHVWFDGLGNPSANALPACQIQRLYTQLVSLPREYESGVFSVASLQVDWSRGSFVRNPERQPPLFWMDTLCIPVDPKHEHLRKKAINQMASIYAAAIRELVLDAELMQYEAATSSALGILARVACSAWMTRSWTLQEGVLARECIFQFKDCAVDPMHEWCQHGPRPGVPAAARGVSFPLPTDEENWAVYVELYDMLWNTLHQDWKSKYHKSPRQTKAGNFQRLRGGNITGHTLTLPPIQGLSNRGASGLDETDHFTMELGEATRLKQLVDTWNELAHRSTTMPEDLHIIIANLLDFNAGSILSIPAREERMRAMILSFNSLPVSLFWNTGPRWRGDGGADTGSNNRWIPTEPSKSKLSLTPVMEVTAEWLKLDLQPGMRGTQVALLHENGVSIAEQMSFVCSISPQRAYHVTILDSQSERDQGAADVSTPHYLITEQSTEATTKLIKGALFRGIHSPGLDTDGVVKLSYACPVTLRPLQRDLNAAEQHVVAEYLSCNTEVSVKYDPIPNFTRHPRRIQRGSCTQGGVAIIMLLPIPTVLGLLCLLLFIVTLARPPHAFTPTAKGLLAAFVVLYVGCTLVGLAWLFFVETVMYRMWLASFETAWVPEEERGWWARYMAFERWLGRVERAVYTCVRRGVRALWK
ncbi:hypothetical protein C7974DRAFT_195424 [Boeremia exigua]|uniref:uncharacterized protein n=1 Tax=Boeremia exigua TaxID=749465 RepID=UPI001E8CF233|nr:uncharacterized protein C7974DRAFT_195424 [Boeremia exigua]KAH6625142.1 hypothetical protein C7974DRAFT_195424 [Boeremia exigua]